MSEGDLHRRILELEAALEACREPTSSPDPVLTLDSSGRIIATNGAWFGSVAPPRVGGGLTELFVPGSAARLRRCAEADWHGASELTLVLVGGRLVGLSVMSTSDGSRLVALHDLTVRHALDDALEQQRQLRIVAELAGSLARELTDPMSIVQGRLELLLDLGVTDAEVVSRHLAVALEHARRVTASLRNLRLVGRSPLPSIEALGLLDLLDESLDLLGPRRERVRVEVDPPDLQVGGEPAILARVLVGVIRFALEGAGRAGLLVTARRLRGQVTLLIGPRGRPRGPLDPEHRELALDEALLNSVGGSLLVHRSGSEVHVELSLPLAPATRLRPRPVESALVVVGSPVFHDAVSQVLEKDGYAFHRVCSSREALSVLESQDGSIDALVAELIQGPGPSGLALAEMVLARRPDWEGRVLVASQTRLEGLPAPIVPVSWPLRRAELLEALGRRVRRR